MKLPEALHSRDYRLFWGGFALSSMGSQFATVAMAWQIYELTDSPLSIGLIGLARALPGLALVLVGGVVADAVDRRRLMMVTMFGHSVVSAGLVGLTVSGSISPLALYLAAGTQALFTAFETPARQSIVPHLVPQEAISSAIALNGTQRSVGSIAGPSLAGLLLAATDASACYMVEAVSWLAMLGALALIRARPDSGIRRGSVSIQALADGLQFVLANPILLLMMITDFGATMLGSPHALLPVYARDILQAGPQGLGMLHSASALGAIAGGAVMSFVPAPRQAALWVMAGVGLYAMGLVGFGMSTSLWAAALLLAFSGIGNTVSTVLRSTIDLLVAPNELRGRVASIRAAFTNSGPQLGQLRAGAVAEVWGAPAAALAGGIMTLALVACLAMLPPVRRFQLPEPQQASR